MQLQPVFASHIVVDELGVARLAATPRYKVRHIAVERTALGMTPEEIVAAHPDVLTLSEVHAALAYYYDNQEAMDAEIAKADDEVERLRAASPEPPALERMRALKRKQDEDAA